MCKIIELAEYEEVTVYNMVKKLRKMELDVEEETVRRILKELEKFGIIKFKGTSFSKTKKEKKVYSLIVPPNMAKNIVKVFFSTRKLLRKIIAINSLVVVLVKDEKYSIVSFVGKHEFEAIFDSISTLVKAYKPEFSIIFFQDIQDFRDIQRSQCEKKNIQGSIQRQSSIQSIQRKHTIAIVSPYGVSYCCSEANVSFTSFDKLIFDNFHKFL